MKSLRTSVMAAAVAAAVATPAFATELTIAIVNNGHMINMQKVAEAYTADTVSYTHLTLPTIVSV